MCTICCTFQAYLGRTVWKHLSKPNKGRMVIRVLRLLKQESSAKCICCNFFPLHHSAIDSKGGKNCVFLLLVRKMWIESNADINKDTLYNYYSWRSEDKNWCGIETFEICKGNHNLHLLWLLSRNFCNQESVIIIDSTSMSTCNNSPLRML